MTPTRIGALPSGNRPADAPARGTAAAAAAETARKCRRDTGLLTLLSFVINGLRADSQFYVLFLVFGG
jgi:hypothetical protein